MLNVDVISVYPNSVRDSFKIASSISLNNASMTRYNSLDKKVKTNSYLNEPINSSDLQSGVYFYSISEQQKVIYKGKIIKK